MRNAEKSRKDKGNEKMIKSYCLKGKCTYRRLVGENKAFCMLPRCIFNQSENHKEVTEIGENSSAKEIIKRSKELGLIS